MDEAKREVLLRRLANHYARFDQNARSIEARTGPSLEAYAPVAIERARDKGLTPREHKVLELIAEGLTDRQVADQLEIGEATVKTYVRGILIKLQARNRTHAVMNGIRQGHLSIGGPVALAA